MRIQYASDLHLEFADNYKFVNSIPFKVLEEMEVRRVLSDFRQIMYNGEKFLPVNYNAEHEKCLSFIKQSVAESTAERIVVVTHHLPTAAVVAPWHKGSQTGSAFVTELSKFIEGSRIDAWIYGHSHTNFDAEIVGTHIVSNQLGYLQLSEQRFGFSGEKFIEV